MLQEAVKQAKITQFNLSKLVFKIFLKIKLKPSTSLVLIYLCNKYPNIFPKQKTIAKELNISLRSVNNSIDELRKHNLILSSGGSGDSLKYFFSQKFFELAEITQPCAKNTQGGTQILRSMYNKQHEQNKKEGFNFSKKNPGYLKDIEHAKAVLMSYNRYNLNPKSIEAIKQIQDHWNFNIKDHDVLMYLQENRFMSLQEAHK